MSVDNAHIVATWACFTGDYQCIRCGERHLPLLGAPMFCVRCEGVSGLIVRRPGVGDRVWLESGHEPGPPSVAHVYICKVGTVAEVRPECIGITDTRYDDAYAVKLDEPTNANEVGASFSHAVVHGSELRPLEVIAPWRVWWERRTRGVRTLTRRALGWGSM